MRLLVILVTILVASACSTKKTETVSESPDTVAVDTVLATTLAPSMLAFDVLDGFSTNKSLPLPDSTNYFHLTSQEDLEQRFSRSKEANASTSPDFIINYVIAAACAPDLRPTTITLDKVVTGENSIDVYLNMVRGTASKTKTIAAQLFVIERREGYPVMQFYVNGAKDKALVLVENQ